MRLRGGAGRRTVRRSMHKGCTRLAKAAVARPTLRDEAPAWSNTDKAAIEALILDYAKAGHSSVIGTLLRDRHAVPNARLVLGRRMAPCSMTLTSVAPTLRT